MLKEALATATGKKRIDFTAEQRRRLALKGKALTPKNAALLPDRAPATILGWFRQFAAQKCDSSKGRPRKEVDIRKLVVSLAHQNPGWGYTKIRDTLRGLKMVFVVIETKTRALHIAGIRLAPDGAWMQQMARNLLDPADGFLRNASYLIHDRDPSFTAPSALPRLRSGREPKWKDPASWTFPLRLTKAWTALLKSSGVKCAPIPAHSPNCNPHAERFVKTIRSECLDHFVIFGERHLRHLIKQFIEHYLMERCHQGIGSQIIKPKASPSNDNAMLEPLECRSRLGGLLDYYYHWKAA